MGHNFWTGSDRDFWLVAKSSLYNGAFVSDHPFWRKTSRFYVTWLQKIWKKNEKNVFLQTVKVKGQTQGQGQIKVKGQGPLKICTILYVNQCDIVEFVKNGIWLLKSWMFNRLFSKLTHILLGPIRCNLQNIGLIRKNVTYVSMATKIPIIKYREFLHISMCYISAINEDIASKFTPVMQGNKWRIQKNQMTLKCQGQGQTHQKPWKSPVEP